MDSQSLLQQGVKGQEGGSHGSVKGQEGGSHVKVLERSLGRNPHYWYLISTSSLQNGKETICHCHSGKLTQAALPL